MTGTLVSGAPSPARTSSLPMRSASVAVASAGSVAAVGCGALVAAAPKIAFALAVVVALSAVVWRWPAVAAYLVVGVTPLVVGIDRGRLLPVLRPNEALVVMLIAVLSLRLAVTVIRRGDVPRLRLHAVEYALLAMAVANSILPIAWLTVQGTAPTGDDISYSLVLWKYIAVYAVVRFTATSATAVRRCLLIIESTSIVVGALAILQALDILGVRSLLAAWYSPLGNLGALDLARAGSTLSLPAATADLMIMTSAIATGLWLRERKNGPWHGSVIAVAVLATFAAGEFSSVLGLVAAAVFVALMLRRREVLAYTAAGLLVGLVVMWPIVNSKLEGFQTASGFPDSWIGRWRNLNNYFWPELFSGAGWKALLGVQPSARVPVASQATGFVWIESGYTWLLWSGGVPLFAAYIYFVRSSLALTVRAARALVDAVGVAALGAATGVVVDVVLMTFDPHLTYRGSADCLLALLAMCAAAAIDGRLLPRRGDDQSASSAPLPVPVADAPPLLQRDVETRAR